MSAITPITIWGHWAGPNPWKVVLILEALQFPYDLKLLEFTEVKQYSYTKLNPNGRLPTIEDPNTGITIWETGAIIQYLIEQYDKQDLIPFSASPESYLIQRWLAFQISEKIQSAIDRYVNETFRIVGVIEVGLQRNGTGWLVGDKCTYADLAFVTWATVGEGLLRELKKHDDFGLKYPHYTSWLDTMNAREDVKKIKSHIVKGRADHGLPP